MVSIGLLVVGGVASAIWRQYHKRQHYQDTLSLPSSTATYTLDSSGETRIDIPPQEANLVFDDVGEIYHYQSTSWYAFAFAASGAWFYAPAVWVSFPLLGYNAYHFFNTVRHSDTKDQKSPLTVFEVIGIVGTLATNRPLATSVLFLFSFGTRKLLLQAGNISNSIGPSRPFNPKFARVWVLRDEVEIEIAIADLQPNDIIVFQEGETIVVQGKVVEGEGTVQQFSLHKKIKNVPKQVGDKVFPFTQLKSGCLYISPE